MRLPIANVQSAEVQIFRSIGFLQMHICNAINAEKDLSKSVKKRSVKPLGLLHTNRAHRARWFQGKTSHL